MTILDRIPLSILAILAVMMALAPFSPQPHLFEKIGMLMDGQLVKPMDIFDLFWHSLFPVLLVLKLLRERQKKMH